MAPVMSVLVYSSCIDLTGDFVVKVYDWRHAPSSREEGDVLGGMWRATWITEAAIVSFIDLDNCYD
jgi:hypothetical protein